MRWVVLALLAATAPAFADDVKLADEKFDAALKLQEAHDDVGACKLFHEAYDLNPSAIGKILNVAKCEERAGKVATAIHYFSDARDRAREQNEAEAVKAAEERLAILTPRAPHVAIALSETYNADAKLLVANKVVDIATASDVAVDPGEVSIVVSVPGRVSFTKRITIAEGEHKAVAVPKLGYPVTACRWCRALGKSAVAVGGVSLAAGVVIGLVSHSRWNSATQGCTKNGNDLVCDSGKGPNGEPSQIDRVNSARSLGDVGSVFGIAGGVLAVGGAALWFFSPKPEEDSQHVSIVPVVTPDQAGLAAVGRF